MVKESNIPIELDLFDSFHLLDAWTDKPEEHVGEMTEQQLRAYQRRQRIAVMKVESRKLLFEGNFDGYVYLQAEKKKADVIWRDNLCRLLISSQYSPESVIKKLYPLLSGSRPIVVYSLSKENLLEAAWYMRNSRDFLNADITESSLRRYQVKLILKRFFVENCNY